MKKNICILASKDGSNAEVISKYFMHSEIAQVSLVATNNPKAGVIKRINNLNIPSLETFIFDYKQTQILIKKLKEKNIDIIILAGFLKLIPKSLLNQFDTVINIHPSLLPKFGGKGMYGLHVHQEVIKSKEKISGITIHYVNEIFDSGKIIFQATCPVSENETAETLSEKIKKLEHHYFPKVVDTIVLS